MSPCSVRPFLSWREHSLREPAHQARLADARVAHQHHLEQELVVLDSRHAGTGGGSGAGEEERGGGAAGRREGRWRD